MYTAADVARTLGISKMSVLRYLEAGRMPAPRHFLPRRGTKVWLWDAKEYDGAIALGKYLCRQPRKGFRVR
jgi:hypothetical protein